MRRFIIVATLLVLSMGYVSALALAQEEDTEYSWGTISSVSSNQIVVTEYDYNKDEEIDVIYRLDSNTELQGVDSLESLNVGDNVNIEYAVKGEENVAKIIVKEEYTPSQTYEEAPEDFLTE